jgi:hypothetical protein
MGFELDKPGSTLEALGVLAAVVAVHEAGHFFAAKSQDVKVRAGPAAAAAAARPALAVLAAAGCWAGLRRARLGQRPRRPRQSQRLEPLQYGARRRAAVRAQLAAGR